MLQHPALQLVLSKGILKEFTEVAKNPRISKYVDQDDVDAFLEILRCKAKIIRVKSKSHIVKADPADSARFGANYLRKPGDNGLLP